MTPPSTTSSSPPYDPYVAFRLPTYRLYVFGWLTAMVGTHIQSAAIIWEMYQRTGEALSLGFVGLALAMPTMILALPAGYLADKFNRRNLILVSLLGMTITSLSLACLSFIQGPTYLMYLILTIDAAMVTIGRPSRVALLPQIIPASVYPNAVKWNTSLMQIAVVFGPAIGGFIILYSVPVAYLLAAITSLAFAYLLWQMNIEPRKKRVGQVSIKTLLGGIDYLWQKPLLLAMISLDLFAVLLGGATYLLPIFAEDILQVGPRGYGILRAAPALGACCMACLLIYLPPMKRAGLSLLLNVAGFGVVTIIFGLSKSFWLSFAMLFLTGAFDNVSMVIRHTLQQLLTPDHMRGRVSAVTSIFVGASNELGGLESGLVAYWFGPIISVVSGGIGTLVVVIITAWVSPQLRYFGVLEEANADTN